MADKKNTFCRICEPSCPISVTFNDSGKATKLSPNLDHPGGGIPCHKGLSFLDVHNSPDRMNTPLKRQNPQSEDKGEFAPVTWDTAFEDIGQTILALQEKHGPNSLAFFNGNPSVFDSRGLTAAMPLLMKSGTKFLFNSGTQDMTNKFRGAFDIYGTRVSPIPDLGNTNYLLCLGSNPKVSHWTLIAQPNDSLNVLKEVKARGGKTVFVNPRKTESSVAEIGETLLIKPGTDVYFLAAVLNEIDKLGGVDIDHVNKHAKNLDGLLAFAKRYPVERAANVSGISAEDIKQVAKDFIAADGASVFISTGVGQSGQGLLTHWLAEMINFVTGNLGQKGGTYLPRSFMNKKIPCDVTKLSTFKTSIGDVATPPPGIGLPSVILPDLIESGEIKALIVIAGNPILTVGGEERMRKAFQKLDLLVTIDIMVSATSELAHYNLPGTSWIERADINFIGSGAQGGIPYVHYTDAMEKPGENRKPEWWIYSSLAQALGIPCVLDMPEAAQKEGFAPLDRMLGQSELSIEQLKNMTQQTAILPDIEYDDIYKTGILHADKKIECYPPSFETAGLFERCEKMYGEYVNEPEGTLRLGSLRTNQMHNTWMSNVGRLRKGTLERNPLHMSPHDAKARGLLDGDEVSVFNEHGRIQTILRVTDDMRPGALAMSHGYSKKNYALSVASELRGANCNALMPSAADSFEPLSNMSRLCAVKVEVELAT